MERQLDFFAPAQRIEPADPNVHPAARKRLGGHSRIILGILRAGGRVSSRELVRITHRFSGRIYDLREAGCVIETKQNHETGESQYLLTYDPSWL